MSDIPQEALQAALAHARSQPLLWQYISDPDIRDLLEAAAPALRADERRKVAEEQREAALVVVSAEDLDVAIAYACRDQDGNASPCVARLRAALPERTTTNGPDHG